jgi:hypothetical protein
MFQHVCMNFVRVYEFLMFSTICLCFFLISYVFMNFLCFCEFDIFYCFASELFCFLIPSRWLGCEYYHAETLRCWKGESASYLMHMMAES